MTDSLSAAAQAAAQTLATTSDSAQLDAAVLLCHVLDCPRSFLLSHPETPLTAEQAQRFAQLVERRARGEPVAYLTGTREFWSLSLKVTPAVLIPRPETETLVEAALARLPADRETRVADLGTGSGAIALAVAHERPHAHVLATEMSTAALVVARDNARTHCIAHAAFVEGHWLEALAGQRFDMIVSNPPYVREADPHLETLKYEPREALVSGPDGLDALREIIRDAPGRLEPGGWLLLEHGADQADIVRDLLHQARLVAVETIPDLAGLPRVSLGRKHEPVFA